MDPTRQEIQKKKRHRPSKSERRRRKRERERIQQQQPQHQKQEQQQQQPQQKQQEEENQEECKLKQAENGKVNTDPPFHVNCTDQGHDSDHHHTNDNNDDDDDHTTRSTHLLFNKNVPAPIEEKSCRKAKEDNRPIHHETFQLQIPPFRKESFDSHENKSNHHSRDSSLDDSSVDTPESSTQTKQNPPIHSSQGYLLPTDRMISFVYPRESTQKEWFSTSITNTRKDFHCGKPYVFPRIRQNHTEMNHHMTCRNEKQVSLSSIGKEPMQDDESLTDILYPKKENQKSENPNETIPCAFNLSLVDTQNHENTQNHEKHFKAPMNLDESLNHTTHSNVINTNPIGTKSLTLESKMTNGSNNISTTTTTTNTNIPPNRQTAIKSSSPSSPKSSSLAVVEDVPDVQNCQLTGRTIEDVMNDIQGKRPRSNSTDGVLNLPRRGLCDERMVLESHQWNLSKFIKNSSKNIPVRPRGFINLGNTCFLNATLQCLAYLPTFCQCVVSLPTMDGGKVTTGKKITMSMRSLLRKVHGLDDLTNGDNTHSPIAPKAIVNAIPFLSGSGRGYKFRPGRQEDAHEFLVHLLDIMNDGELKAAGINQSTSGWRERLPIPRLDETTFIHRVFGGYLRSQVICTNCGYKSNTYDPFLDLALEVTKNTSTSLSSAFAEFTRKETLDAANKWKCSGCKKRVCATKQLTVFRPPLSLVAQLKRFTYGGGFPIKSDKYRFGHHGKSSGMGSKVQKPIEFPTSLKLPLSDGRHCEYELKGIIIHEGGSATSGHYTACVRKPGMSGEQWYHMDDSSVSPISEQAVIRQKNAYVLFYSRKEVRLEFPDPPPRSSMTAAEAIAFSEVRSRVRANSVASRGELNDMSSDSNAPNIVTVANLEHTSYSASCEKTTAGSIAHEDDLENNETDVGKNGKMERLNSDFETKKRDRDLTCKSGQRQLISLKRDTDSVHVFVGGLKKKSWAPVTKSDKDDRNKSLLGDRHVQQWNDSETFNRSPLIRQRQAVIKELEFSEKERKRKFYLDKWDTGLDEGKIKKVKQSKASFFSSPSSLPNNAFHRLQKQAMSRKKKGFFK